MEEPTSGPGPKAPAGAAAGEPVRPGEPVPYGDREGSGAVRTAGAEEPAGADGAAGAEETAGAEPGGSDVPDGPAGPRPIGVGTTPTGQAAVDTTLRRLADADHLPASGHLRVYEDVHRGLRDVLAALDQHPGPPAPSSTTHDLRS
ncbi:hypothetical protein [Streptomyces caniferus]|uniref:hypothetical protein n=1 Tax=Streptomyces caniferus TaxID=285557 RepID=UPI003F4D01B8